tara:strand:+ start:50 stop:451 length:402 start_codon:yes stop_codon:yes gene_type:complete
MLEIKDNIRKKDLRDFGILIGFGFPIIIGWFLPAIGGHDFRAWTFWVGLFSLIFAFFKPTSLFYFYKLWMILGFSLGWINSRLILGLVYVSILLPISIVMRMIGYDPLKIKRANLNSYRENNKNQTIDLTRIF